MTFTHDARAHLLLLNADFGIAARRLTRCLDDHTLEHALPGAFADCNQALAKIINYAAAGAPAILDAMQAGRRSTQDVITDGDKT